MAFHVSKTSILSTLDYIEDGRADIYKWSETRKSKRKGISGKLYQFKKLFIDKSVSRNFDVPVLADTMYMHVSQLIR